MLLFAVAIAPLGFDPGARADLITDWGGTASSHISQNALGGSPGYFQTWRGGTMVRVAMFDAANATLGGYTPYALNVTAPE